MDDVQFDAMTRTLGSMSTRRAALSIAGASSGAAALGALGFGADAKKKKGKKKDRCTRGLSPCSADKKCCSKNCCYNPYTDYHFCEDRSLLVCCSEDIQGACAIENPVCCPTNQFEPVPYCCFEGEECCDSGCCPARRAAAYSERQAARSHRGVPQLDVRPGRS